MQLAKALEKEYGSKVSKEDVDKAYKQASEQYGDQFSQVLTEIWSNRRVIPLKSVHKNAEYAVNRRTKDLIWKQITRCL